MRELTSKLAPDIIGFLELRESLGYSRNSYEYQLSKIDEYAAKEFPSLDVITEDIVLVFIASSATPAQNNILGYNIQRWKLFCSILINF